jgi:DNA-binding CsgD family transcriptional regulator
MEDGFIAGPACASPVLERGQVDLPGWVPEWIDTVGAPAWLSAPDHRIVWINDSAADLLGVDPSRALGRPCYEVVKGIDLEGRPWCSPTCRARTGDRTVEPFTIRMPPVRDRWISVLSLSLEAPDGTSPWVAHLVIELDRARRAEQYLTRISSRSPSKPARARTLTARELEILDLLERGEDVKRIAARLHISYVTARNHVQHIMAKLGVHSRQEAVALHVLGETLAENTERDGDRGTPRSP